jgi:arginyl-tRNA synthetase
MNIEHLLCNSIAQALHQSFGIEAVAQDIALQPTKKEFEGDLTFVVFPYTKPLKKSPEEIAKTIGEYLKTNDAVVADYNVVKGFLNIVIAPSFWIEILKQISLDNQYFTLPPKNEKVMVEYSSPNTNKPLHLGHLRNNFLGYAVSNILTANGYEVLKVNLVNDRGIHICKSMLAYQKYGQGETPQSRGIKGDHLIGEYYVHFEKENKKIIAPDLEKWLSQNPEADKDAIDEQKEKLSQKTWLMQEAQEMLRQWEKGNPDIVNLWKKMNGWVYEGFDETYKNIGVAFDKFYYESNTYLLGKSVVEEGLAKNIFYQKPDASVWVDLTADGLDHKLLLRADGTSVYMTQDMGTADLKYKDFPMQKSLYVIGNEQDYHMKVLKLIMQKLGRPYADGMYHLSYGMVELPDGKMKSREGTVVDADELLQEMINIAEERTKELGKIDGFSAEEAQQLYQTLALGALKYYLLKVEPKKKMLFNPKESIDFQGDTGVYIQYTYAKINAIVRRAEILGVGFEPKDYETIQTAHQIELDLIQFLTTYQKRLKEAGENYAPSSIASFAYELCKIYSRFYAEVSIFNAETVELQGFRVALSAQTGRFIKQAMALLGIDVPSRM